MNASYFSCNPKNVKAHVLVLIPYVLFYRFRIHKVKFRRTVFLHHKNRIYVKDNIYITPAYFCLVDKP